MKFLFIILSVSLFTHSVFAIINGNKIPSAELPQIQKIVFSNAGGDSEAENLCTATLIGPKTILTAAHCVLSQDAYFQLPSGRSAYLKSIIKNPNYNGRTTPGGFAGHGDLAIGILNTAVTDVTPLSLSHAVPKDNQSLLITGVGSPRFEVRQYGYMNTVRVSGVEINLSSSQSTFQVADVGDSGGPMILKGPNKEAFLIAVNSTSAKTKDYSSTYGYLAKPYMMAGYRVSSGKNFDPFIIKVMNQYGLKICGVNTVCSTIRTGL